MNTSTIEIRDKVYVQGYHFVKHDGYWQRIAVLLNVLHQLETQIRTLGLEIIFPDGEPIQFVGIDYLVDQIIKQVDLPPEKFSIVTHNKDYKNNKVTVKYYSCRTFLQIFNEMKSVERPFTTGSEAKLFGASFGRMTLERFLLSAYLGRNFPNDSVVIFQPHAQMINFEFKGLESYYKDQLDWFQSYRKDPDALNYSNGESIDQMDACKDYKRLYAKYLIEVVGESDCHSSYWFTEKSLRCLIAGKPFLLLAGAGSLANLQKMGFKTFSPLFDESYDAEIDSNRRVDMIQQEIDRISHLDRNELMANLQPIVDYNRDNYKNIVDHYYKNFHD